MASGAINANQPRVSPRSGVSVTDVCVFKDAHVCVCVFWRMYSIRVCKYVEITLYALLRGKIVFCFLICVNICEMEEIISVQNF